MATSVTPRLRPKASGVLNALPATFWVVVFFILPLLIVLAVSFMSRGEGNRPSLPLTLENYADIFGPTYFPIFLRSIWVALMTTVVCLLMGYPLAFFISTRSSARVRQLALFLVILPFWTNFLVRTYAIQTIIGREGTINSILLNLGIIQEPLELIFTSGAVLLGLVYGYLPFMVLPIYASVERFDFRLVEASNDLGANDWRAFWRIVFPLTLPGVIAGCILVFIPAIGTYVTSDLLGGTQGLMIGNLIARQFGGTGNWPRGSAASIVMMAMVMLSLLFYSRFARER
jgi:spermidine/putrescine transport system permease protein